MAEDQKDLKGRKQTESTFQRRNWSQNRGRERRGSKEPTEFQLKTPDAEGGTEGSPPGFMTVLMDE